MESRKVNVIQLVRFLMKFRMDDLSLEYWKNLNNQRKYFDWIGKELKITKFEDWYDVSPVDIYHRGGTPLLTQFYDGQFTKALMTVYSDVNWLPWKFVFNFN